MANVFEDYIKQFCESDSIELLHSGWPDFLVVQRHSEKVTLFAIELKSPKDKVRENQKKVLDALSTVMPVYLLRSVDSDDVRAGVRIIDWKTQQSLRSGGGRNVGS